MTCEENASNVPNWNRAKVGSGKLKCVKVDTPNWDDAAQSFQCNDQDVQYCVLRGWPGCAWWSVRPVTVSRIIFMTQPVLAGHKSLSSRFTFYCNVNSCFSLFIDLLSVLRLFLQVVLISYRFDFIPCLHLLCFALKDFWRLFAGSLSVK